MLLTVYMEAGPGSLKVHFILLVPDTLPNFKSVPMPLLIMLGTITVRPLHLAAFGSEASYEIFLYFDVCYCSCWLESQNLVGLIVKKMSLCSAK